MAGESILIVEDHTMIAEYVASVITGAGYQAIQAPTLSAARLGLARHRPDLMLCDRYLPDGEGQSLLPQLAPSGSHPAIPAIILSADMNDSDRQALLEAGFVDALCKPCPAPVLLQRIAVALAGRTTPAPVPLANAALANKPVLDDAAALGICAGNAEALRSMRRLFAADLPDLRRRLAACAAERDVTRLGQELHRLSASAAWCGAVEVKARCERMGQDSGWDMVELDEALARLEQALQEATSAAPM
jgi:DNA-binding response OmpR family regulator